MIECKNFSVKYGKKEILHSVSFSACPNEITVILGKNGCGKSTLLRALSGIIPYSGTIKLNGSESRSLKPTTRAKLISMMPQILQSPEITVRHLVSYGRYPYTGLSGIMSEADRIAVENVMAKTEISELADSFVNRISGGERQKAYFAMLLAQDTPILLLDEPGAHLDTEYMKNLCSFLKCERDSGKTVVAVLHDINCAVELADRIVVIEHGGVLFNGTPEAFCESDIPQKAFGVQRFDCVEASDGNTSRIFFR